MNQLLKQNKSILTCLLLVVCICLAAYVETGKSWTLWTGVAFAAVAAGFWLVELYREERRLREAEDLLDLENEL
jgi:positive regulator of sigma E activity